jgi:hypothetical protein
MMLMASLRKLIKEFFLNRTLWLLDLVICITFGAYAGYWGQIAADSGEIYPDKVVRAIIFGGLSYIFAFPPALILRRKFSSAPGWVSFGMLGAFFFAVSKGVVLFFITNLDSDDPQSLGEYVWSLLPHMIDSVIGLTIIFTLATLALLFLARLIILFLIILLGLHRTESGLTQKY